MRSPTIVWDAIGLSSKMAGIERLVGAYTHALARWSPDIVQIALLEPDYEWLGSVHASVEQRFARNLPGGVGIPRSVSSLHSGAYHSWGHSALPALFPGRSVSVTIHDWTPFARVGVRLRHRIPWQVAIATNLASAGTLHFTIPELTNTAPPWLQPFVARKSSVVGTLDVMGWTRESGNLGTSASGVGGPYILTIGTLVGRKRLQDSRDLWNSPLFAGVPKLVFAGSGTEVLGASDRHVGLGYVSEEELMGLVNHASLLLTVSDQEGLNLPAREALSVGTKVLGTVGALGPLAGRPGVVCIGSLNWGQREEAARVLRLGIDTAMAANAVAVTSPDGAGPDPLSAFLIGESHRLADRN